MKKILFTLAALSLATFSFADDFGFGEPMDGASEDFDGGDFGGGFEESSSPVLTWSGEVGADTRAWIGIPAKELNSKEAAFCKENGISDFHNTRGYKKFYDVSKTDLDADVYAKLEANYAGDYTDANIKLKLDAATIKDHPEDVIDEVYANGSFKEGKFQLKAGKMKEVWGKGDKIHVLDNFNANDYTDFVFPDYIDRRIGEIMFKATANLSWDYNLKLEGIFTPWMTADRFASDGLLVPYSMTNLTNTVKSILANNGAYKAKNAVTGGNSTDVTVDGLTLVHGIMDLSDFSTDDLYEDNIRSLKYGQAGLRLTGTAGGIDWGASYYYGHYKQPSANLENMMASLTAAVTADLTYAATSGAEGKNSGYATYLSTNYTEEITALTKEYMAKGLAMAEAKTAATKDVANAHAQEYLVKNGYNAEIALPSLNYDQVQVFGLEAAFVLWKLNTRWEFAYNLTEDTAGDNPWVKNNSISWVAGFDIDLPIHNLNLNLQETGSFILKNNEIEDGIYAKYDVDYNSDGKYTNNKIIVLLSDKWLNEKLTTEVQGIYTIECKEFLIAPKVEYNVSEGLTFTARGVYMYSDNENGEFYNFTADSKHHDKAFLQLSAKYQF